MGKIKSFLTAKLLKRCRRADISYLEGSFVLCNGPWRSGYEYKYDSFKICQFLYYRCASYQSKARK